MWSHHQTAIDVQPVGCHVARVTSGDLGSVAFGAGLTLVATLFVQSAVVPWTQARIRRRERWEDAVHHLSKLLDEQLPQALSEYHEGAQIEELLLSITDESDYDRGRREAALKNAYDRRTKADDELQRAIERTTLYIERVKHLRRSAPLWRTLDARHFLFLKASMDMTLPRALGKTLSPDERQRLWREQDSALKELWTVVRPLATSMRPPPRQALQRGRRWMMTRLRFDQKDQPDASGHVQQGSTATQDAEPGHERPE